MVYHNMERGAAVMGVRCNGVFFVGSGFCWPKDN